MSVNRKYKKLFELKVLHLFFLNKGNTEFDSMSPDEQNKIWNTYDLRETLTFHPSSDAARNLNNYNLVFKTTQSGFLVLARVDPNNPDKSFIPISDLDLTFYMTLDDPFYSNYSLGQVNSLQSRQTCYFNNDAGNNGSSFPDLSLPPSSFVAGENYETGSMVEFSGDFYESVEDITNASINPNRPNSGWRSIPNRSSVNSNDRIAIFQDIISFQVNTPDIEFTVQLTDINGIQVYSEQLDTFNGKRDFKIYPSNAKEGYYTLNVTNNADGSNLKTFTFYFFKDAVPENLLGIVHILGGSDKGSYSMTNSAGDLTSPEYRLRIRNRHTYWRYLSNQDQSMVLETNLNPLTFNGFISVNHRGDDLPNPGVRMIKPEATGTYSEIFI
ncbi:MAG: hypothetical protein KGY70_11860 [Bacteroidales bacterium]|nr:hypothetical protein [Bacteroidales bacterium]